MSLTGWPLLVLSMLLAVATPVATMLFIWKRRPQRLVGLAAGLGMVLASQFAAVLSVGVALNHRFQSFASWNDVLGGDRRLGGAVQGGPAAGAGLGQARHLLFRRSRNLYVMALTGPRSKVHNAVYVWLPPQYREPAYAKTRFPVIELFSGYPGTPSTWFHAMDSVQRLQAEVAAKRARPFILVAPVINVWPGHDTECANIPGGPQVATWLTQDVPDAITHNFRAVSAPQRWGLMGYSTGGFCAAKLALQNPHLYGAAVSMSGYFSPISPLITRSAKLRQEDSPLALIRQKHRSPVALLLAASRQDPGTVDQTQAMAAAAQPPTRVFTYIVPKGGHNPKVWSAMLPTAYQWLTRQLGYPAR